MKEFVLVIFMFHIQVFLFAQDNNANKNTKWLISGYASNPEREASIGWYDISGEAVDGNDVKERSFSTGIILNYFTTQEISLRLKMGYTRIHLIETLDNAKYLSSVNTTHIISSMESHQAKYEFYPGFSRTITSRNSKVSFYTGLELPIMISDKYVAEFNYMKDGGVKNYTELKEITEIPGGFSTGLGLLGGVNFSLSSRVDITAELQPSLLYMKWGGEVIRTTVSYYDNTNGNIQIIENQVGKFHDSHEKILYPYLRFSFGIAYKIF
jgi:hypothetical protein